MLGSFRMAINSANKENIRKEISELSEHDLNEEELLGIIHNLPSIVEVYTGVFEVEFKKKTISYKDYEGMIWDIGEKFRQIIKRNKKLKAKDKIFKEIEKV